MSTHLVLGFLFSGAGGGEIIVIFVVVLLMFGPTKLPQIARAIGRAIDELRRASQDFKDQIMSLDEGDNPLADKGELSDDDIDASGMDDALYGGEEYHDPYSSKEDETYDEYGYPVDETGEPTGAEEATEEEGSEDVSETGEEEEGKHGLAG